ncbi:AMP-binding protein [Mycetohabitans endofungorum]|uniref:AMP-binding protein n=1 Tax=Mycetohabitans endofungorum TaxID=417203 RepID=UPI002B055C47|nr:AMP-binding protein [Mycetohabitans endofungorum]
MATALVLPPAQIEPKDGWSYVRGRTDVPLSGATVGEFLGQTAQRFADRLAVVFQEQGVRWTWREFFQEVDVLAAGLASLGIGKGDRVGIWSPNRVEWLVTQFATARIGAILVNINPAYRLAELDYALNKVGCRAIVAAEQFKTSRYLEMLQTLAPELAQHAPGELRAARLPELRHVIRMGTGQTPGMLRYDDLVQQGRSRLDMAQLAAISGTLDAQDPINIQFTSGTTGNPKGATLTHRNIVNNARFIAMSMRLSEQDRLCIPVPLYHCFGMVLACVSTGAAMVFPAEGFDPAATLAAVALERCTALHGVPTMFIAELDHPDFEQYDLSQLRTGIMAGSPCPIETMKRVVARMHLGEITIAYGMTETSPVSFQSSTSDPLEKRTTTVGRIQPHLEAKIIDALGNIVGRLKDMVIRGGENIYPREIEEFLFRHLNIQSVQVFGVPDAQYGEELCAWIVLRPGETATEQDIRDFCHDQIAHYKIPKYVRFVSDLPMTVTGKVQKFVMRAKMIDELKLSSGKSA